PAAVAGSDGSLSITHDASAAADVARPAELPEPEPEPKPAEPLPAPSERTLDKLLPQQENTAVPPESFNPLMPDSSQPAGTEEAKTEPPVSEPTPVLPPLPGPAPAPAGDSEGDIHIDHEGNLVRKAVEPKHKVVQPLPPQESEQPASVSEPVSPAVSKLPPPPEMDLTPSEPIQDDT